MSRLLWYLFSTSLFSNQGKPPVLMHRGFFCISMGQHKFSGSGVEAHIQHGRQGEQTSRRKYQIQRKYIAENAVDHRRKRGAADGCRIDESEDRTRFSSGRASISEALKIVLPAQLVKEARKAMMHRGTNLVER